jgi:ribose-phosphate pyrophosphokinase
MSAQAVSSSQTPFPGASRVQEKLLEQLRTEHSLGATVSFAHKIKQGLDGAPESHLRLVETWLDSSLARKDYAHIVVGPHHAEIVSRDEAEIFRSERAVYRAGLEDRVRRFRSQDQQPSTQNLDGVIVLGGYGSALQALEVGLHLGKLPIDSSSELHSNGELNLRIYDNLRRGRVFIVQTSGIDPNRDKASVLLSIANARLHSAAEIHVIEAHFAYARQDRDELDVDKGRTPISVAEYARAYEEAGATSITALDLHCVQSGCATKIPFHSFPTQALFVDQIVEHFGSQPEAKLLVVAPDAGAGKRGDRLFRALKKRLPQHDIASALLYKDRPADSVVGDMKFVGDTAIIQNRTVIFPDDLADTCGTLTAGAKLMKSYGAKACMGCVTHGIFSGTAIEDIRAGGLLDHLIVPNTIPLRRGCGSLITSVDTSALIAQIIVGIDTGKGLSQLVKRL